MNEEYERLLSELSIAEKAPELRNPPATVITPVCQSKKRKQSSF
jgi:hypothetical protein